MSRRFGNWETGGTAAFAGNASDAEGIDALGSGGSVAVVVLGFLCLGAVTVIALLIGFGAVSAFLIGWAASLSGVVVLILWSAWREHLASRRVGPVTRDEHIAVWDVDLKAERARSERISEWDDDQVIDAVCIKHASR